jgi:hypothetical protein
MLVLPPTPTISDLSSMPKWGLSKALPSADFWFAVAKKYYELTGNYRKLLIVIVS